MDRRDRRALLGVIADELETEPCAELLDAGDLSALCWRAVARSSGGHADARCAAAASGLRDEVLRAYAGAHAVAAGHRYSIDRLRAVMAEMQGRCLDWYW